MRRSRCAALTIADRADAYNAIAATRRWSRVFMLGDGVIGCVSWRDAVLSASTVKKCDRIDVFDPLTRSYRARCGGATWLRPADTHVAEG